MSRSLAVRVVLVNEAAQHCAQHAVIGSLRDPLR